MGSGLLALLSLLASAIGTASQAQKESAGAKDRNRMREYQRKVEDVNERNRKKAETDARRAALARIVNSDITPLPTPDTSLPEAPQQKDLSGYDTTTALSNLAAQGLSTLGSSDYITNLDRYYNLTNAAPTKDLTNTGSMYAPKIYKRNIDAGISPSYSDIG